MAEAEVVLIQAGLLIKCLLNMTAEIQISSCGAYERASQATSRWRRPNGPLASSSRGEMGQASNLGGCRRCAAPCPSTTWFAIGLTPPRSPCTHASDAAGALYEREDREEARRQRDVREAKRMALINYARWGPGSSFRPGGECAYSGCDCEGSLPDHYVLCLQRCHCKGKLHPLPDERRPMPRRRG
jgi:hypothetical protein